MALVDAMASIPDTPEDRLIEIEAKIESLTPRLRALRAKETQINRMLEEHTETTLYIRREVYAGAIVILRHLAARFTVDLKGPIRIKFDSNHAPVIVDEVSHESVSLFAMTQPVERRDAYERYLTAEAA
jgi:hypothetical protein